MLNLPKSFIWILRGATAVPRLKPRAGFVSTCLLIFRYSLNYRKIEPFIFLDFVAIVFPPPPLPSSLFRELPLFPPPFPLFPRWEEEIYLIPPLFPDSFSLCKFFLPVENDTRFPITLFSFLSHPASPTRLPQLIFVWLRDERGKKGKRRKKGKKRGRRGLEKGRRCATLASNRFFLRLFFKWATPG